MPPASFSTPEWVKDAVFYQIFPDRFARSSQLPELSNLEAWDSPPTLHGFKGGNLAGVLEHLDYLQDLGITAIYFNPIFRSAANHRYHTHDYYQVDPMLGGNDALRDLLNAAHTRGMRIILDGVFNHASRGFFQFHHILENGPASPYLDWFHVNGFPLNAYDGQPNYNCWWGLPALPEFNTTNPQVRQFIFDIARYWIEFGIDGWRLDVPFSIDDDSFWQEFRQVVKATNPDAYLVGEIIHDATRWLQGDQFDAVMNYQFTQACLGFFAGGRIDRSIEAGMMGMDSTPVLDATEFTRRASELLTRYPHPAVEVQLNLLDSHDMPRFISLASGDQASLRLAVLFQMTYPGAPCIYYGDEIGMSGGVSRRPEPSRAAFLWEQAEWDSDLLSYYQRLIALRKTYPALRRGEFIPIYARVEVLAYLRQHQEQLLIVVINNGIMPYTLDIPTVRRLPATIWRNLLGAGRVQVQDGHLRGLTLPPRSACILTPTDF